MLPNYGYVWCWITILTATYGIIIAKTDKDEPRIKRNNFEHHTKQIIKDAHNDLTQLKPPPAPPPVHHSASLVSSGKISARIHKQPNTPVPTYAVHNMEPLVQYSQRDPLYQDKQTNFTPSIDSISRKSKDSQADSTNNDYATNFIANRNYGPPPSHRGPPPSHHRSPQPPHNFNHPQTQHHYYKEPEPIIEIIIKESNESLPAPPSLPPPPPPKKEPIQVFYVKYKKNQTPYGKEEVIYEEPIPALTPLSTDIVDQTTEHYIPSVTYPNPPPPSTTLRTIIHPDSEIYHGTGLKVTFGNGEESHAPSGHHDSYYKKRSSTLFADEARGGSTLNEHSGIQTGNKKTLTDKQDEGIEHFVNERQAPFNPNLQFIRQNEQFENFFSHQNPQKIVFPGSGNQEISFRPQHTHLHEFQRPDLTSQRNREELQRQLDLQQHENLQRQRQQEHLQSIAAQFPQLYPNLQPQNPPLTSNSVPPTGLQNQPSLPQSPPYLQPILTPMVPSQEQLQNYQTKNQKLHNIGSHERPRNLKENNRNFFNQNSELLNRDLIKQPVIGLGQRPQSLGQDIVLPPQLSHKPGLSDSNRQKLEQPLSQYKQFQQKEKLEQPFSSPFKQYQETEQPLSQYKQYQQTEKLEQPLSQYKQYQQTEQPLSQFKQYQQTEQPLSQYKQYQQTEKLEQPLSQYNQYQQSERPLSQFKQYQQTEQPLSQYKQYQQTEKLEQPLSQFQQYEQSQLLEQQRTQNKQETPSLPPQTYQKLQGQSQLQENIQPEFNSQQFQFVKPKQNEKSKTSEPRQPETLYRTYSQQNKSSQPTISQYSKSSTKLPKQPSRSSSTTATPSVEDGQIFQSISQSEDHQIINNYNDARYQQQFSKPKSNSKNQYNNPDFSLDVAPTRQTYSSPIPSSVYDMSSIKSSVENKFQRPSNNFNNQNRGQLSSNSQKNYDNNRETLGPLQTERGSSTNNSKKPNKASTVAKLPEEIPDDLREQLLSSGILSNADIQVLDYDKVGDIPIENLPPEALESLYGAGSAPIPSVILANDTKTKPVEMKVVRYDPSTSDGQEVEKSYVQEDSTQVDPVVLNDSSYNRYLPLKVSGSQFPVPDNSLLKGKRISSVVVLAPVDYDFVQNAKDKKSENARTGKSAAQLHGVRFISGDALKNLVRNPTEENFQKWLTKEKYTTPTKQSVVLLVTNSSEEEKGKEIFMYDVQNGEISLLEGQLSSAFVDVAESNVESEDLDNLSANDDNSASASELTADPVNGIMSEHFKNKSRRHALNQNHNKEANKKYSVRI